MKHLIGILSIAVLLGSCVEDVQAPQYVTTPYHMVQPSQFPPLKLNPNNPLTLEGVALGRMLYYDSMLDGLNDRSCSKCHQQAQGFSSEASNALAHVNLAWQDAYLWNGKVEGSMEDIMLFEVEEFFVTDVGRFNNDPFYKKKFKEAFNVDEISSQEIAYALAQFTTTLVSSNSRFDLYLKGIEPLTAQELRGMDLYFSESGDCFHCHGASMLTDHMFHNNGLDTSPALGRMEITGDPRHRGQFKTPTLRNIAETSPYMHDGRFSTLEEVVEFYSTGLKTSETVDPLMKQLHNGGVQLNAQEKADLVAFLRTFTDQYFLNDSGHSNPFD